MELTFAEAEGILVVLLGISTFLYAAIFWHRAPGTLPPPLPAHPIGWKEKALQELTFLQGPFHIEHPKEAMARFASLVDTAIRECYHVDSTPLTTTEILAALSQKGLQEKEKTFVALLKESDWIKFSRGENPQAQWEWLFTTLKEFLTDATTP